MEAAPSSHDELMMQVQRGQQAQTVRGQVWNQATYGRLGWVHLEPYPPLLHYNILSFALQTAATPHCQETIMKRWGGKNLYFKRSAC